MSTTDEQLDGMYERANDVLLDYKARDADGPTMWLASYVADLVKEVRALRVELAAHLPPPETQEWAARQGEVGVDANDAVTPPGCPPMLTLVGDHGIIGSIMGEEEAQHIANCINAVGNSRARATDALRSLDPAPKETSDGRL